MNNQNQNDAFDKLINRMKEADDEDFRFQPPSQPAAPRAPQRQQPAQRPAASDVPPPPTSRPREPQGYPVTRRPPPAQSQPPRQPYGQQPAESGYPVTRRTPPAAQPPQRPAQNHQQTPEDFVVNIRNNEFERLPDAPPPSRARRRPEPPAGGAGSGGGTPPPPQNRSGKGSGAGRWLQALTVAGICVGISIFLAFFVIDSASDLFGLNQPDETTELSITEGMTFRQVVDSMEQAGVITKTFTFSLYSSLKKDGQGVKISENFQPGDYTFNKNMSYDEIISMLRRGIDNTEIVNITFPEGLTIQAIANRLEEKRVCTAEEFINEIRTGDFSEYSFITDMPAPGSEDRYYTLEGFIFPDTYDFYVGEQPSVTVRRFLDNFKKKMTEELQAKMTKRGMTLYETITLASIIQKEAGAVEDMGPVSSVFHNRLANAGTFPMLESDVTTFYVRDSIMPNFPDRAGEPLDGNNNFMAAYSTYYRTGLPVGPICNPGLDAIEAALDPDETPYYFFVTDDKGNYYYAETANKHAENVAVAMPSGDAHGTNVENKKE